MQKYKVEYLPNKYVELKEGQNELSILNNLILPNKYVSVNKVNEDEEDEVMHIPFQGELNKNMPTTPVNIYLNDGVVTIIESRHDFTINETEESEKKIEAASNRPKYTATEISQIIDYDKEETVKTLSTVIKIAEKQDVDIFKKYKKSIVKNDNKLVQLIKGSEKTVVLPLRLRLTIDTMLDYPKETSNIINDYNYSNGEKYLLIENVLAVKTIISRLMIFSEAITNSNEKREFQLLLKSIEDYRALLNHNLDKLFDSTDVKIELISFYELFKYLNNSNIKDINLIIGSEKYKEASELLQLEIKKYMQKIGR